MNHGGAEEPGGWRLPAEHLERWVSKLVGRQLSRPRFGAPDIARAVINGTQPVGLTTEWLLRNYLPSDWQDQRARIATL